MAKPQETPRAAAAFMEYCLLPSGERSLAKLAQKEGRSRSYVVQLERWSVQHHWQERVKTYDAEQAKVVEQAVLDEKKRILTSRFALMHKRVEALDALAGRLLSDAGKKNKLYRKEVRIIGTGKNARPIEVEVFEASLVREIRGLLDDISAEMGERVKTTKQEVTGKDGVPFMPDHNALLSTLSDEEFEQLKQLQINALARLEQQGDDNSTAAH